MGWWGSVQKRLTKCGKIYFVFLKISYFFLVLSVSLLNLISVAWVWGSGGGIRGYLCGGKRGKGVFTHLMRLLLGI